MKLSDLANTPPTPEQPEPIARTVAKIIPLLMLFAKREDQLFFQMKALERHLQKINAGFVLTSFQQQALFKMETHSMIEDINNIIHYLNLWAPNDNPKPPTE